MKAERGKKDNYSIPCFQYLSGKDFRQQPSWMPLHSTLRRAAETQGAWTGPTEDIRPAENVSCRAVPHGTMEDKRCEDMSTAVPPNS